MNGILKSKKQVDCVFPSCGMHKREVEILLNTHIYNQK